MNARERVLAALRHEEPDRIPTHVIYIDGNNVDEILGKEPMSDFDLLAQIKRDYADKDEVLARLNQSIEDLEASTFKRVIEAKAALGLDFGQIGILCLQFINDHQVQDIFGRVCEVVNIGGHFWPFYSYGTILSVEKWEKQVRNPILEIWTKKYTKFVKRFYKNCTRSFEGGDKIFVGVTNDIMGTFESAWQGMGMPFFAAQLHRNPAFIQHVFETYTDFTIAIYNAYMDAGAEIFIESGDLAYKQHPMMSPKQFDELLLPAYRRLTEAVHARKKKIILHTDGFVTPLLDFVIKCGFDGLHSLEPSAGVDLAQVKQKVGNQLCLLGNIDTGVVLTSGTRKAVFEAVDSAIRMAGVNGGFIVSAANMHPKVKVQNLRWMVEATHELGVYPAKEEKFVMM